MNYYKLFYWITRADSIRDFFSTTSNIFTTATIISLAILVITTIGKANAIDDSYAKSVEEEEKDPTVRGWELVRKHSSRWFYVFLIFCLITWFGYMAVPSKKDALLIVGGGGALTFLTTDSTAKQLPSELTGFIVSELKSAAAEAKVEWNTNEAKNKVLEEVKTMSATELIEKMKTDSTLTNIILQK